MVGSLSPRTSSKCCTVMIGTSLVMVDMREVHLYVSLWSPHIARRDGVSSSTPRSNFINEHSTFSF